MVKVVDYREGCVWYEKGYCQLLSVCYNGKFFSQRLNDLEVCDLYLLPFDKTVLMDRIVVEREEIQSLIKKGVRKHWKEIGDKGLGVKFLKKVLEVEFGLKS